MAMMKPQPRGFTWDFPTWTNVPEDHRIERVAYNP